MNKWTTLESAEDRSVNFVCPAEDDGFIEARYVRRNDRYFIAYLSSHTGCKHACRFCHLTSTGQTSFTPVTMHGYYDQADKVWGWYNRIKKSQGEAAGIHYNWMSRGEPLSNPHLLNNAFELLYNLETQAICHGMWSKFKISTIMPIGFNQLLQDVFYDLPVTFYYSIYSTDDRFRKRWLPNAMPVREAFRRFADWQKAENREIKLHWAFIEGENDSEADVHAICDLVEEYKIVCRVNTVRYNPPNNKSQESSQEVIDRNFKIIQDRICPLSKVIPRVGFDVKASCGMFVS